MRVILGVLLAAAAATLLVGLVPSASAHVVSVDPHPGLTVQSIPAPGSTLRGGGSLGTGALDGGCAATVLGLSLDQDAAQYYRSGRVALGADRQERIVPTAALPALPSCTGFTSAATAGSYDARAGFAVAQRANFATGTSQFFAVPSSVEWYMARCDLAGTQFAPGVGGMARAMQRCGFGAPPSWAPFANRLTSLGPYALGTQGDVPYTSQVPGLASAWVLSCVRMDAIEVRVDGTEVLHSSLMAHDWFMVLDPADPLLASRAAMGMQTTTWYDRSGDNGCPAPLPSRTPPLPTGILCLNSALTHNGVLATKDSAVGEPLGSTATGNAYLGAAELHFATGGLRTLKADRINAPGVAVTSHTDTDGLRSWVLVPITPGHHRVAFKAETLCPFGNGGATELVTTVLDLITPAGACPARVYDPGAPALRFHVGFTSLPAGVTIGSSYHGGVVTHVGPHAAAKYIVVEVPANAYLLFSKGVAMDANVVYCDQAQTGGQGGLVPAEAHYGYNMPAIEVEDAWDLTLGTTARSVCVIDSGLDMTHPDFVGSTIVDSESFVPGTPTADDDHGHGTHVTGIAAARTNNGVGVPGVAQAGIYVAKALDSANSFADWAWVVDAIYWCADRADVISMSIYGNDRDNAPPASVATAIGYAYTTQGRLLVSITGNNHIGPCTGGAADCVTWPGRYNEVIAVGCTDAGTAVCGFSNQGPETELVAPGNAITSTCLGGGYCPMSGTSMSAPHVAGAAALIWSYVPGLSRDDLRTYLDCKATDLGAAGRDDASGFGILNVYASLQAAIAGSCAAPPCGATILMSGTPVTPGRSTYGPTPVSVSHTGPWHVTAERWSASDGATVIHTSTGHESWNVYVGDGRTRYITLEVDLGTPKACTVTATWRHTN